MLKVGLVGYGFMGHMHAQCYQATGEATIAALADVDAAKRDEAKSAFGCQTFPSIEEMVASADLDAVDVCTPTYLHEEHVIAAARAKRNIMCEKPMSLTVESCDRMIEAVKSAGVALQIGQVIRFWPEYQVVKELVDSGKYGKVQWLSASRRSPVPTWSWQSWLLDPARSGGGVMDLHIHDQDYIAYLIGMPKTVTAAGALGSGGGLDSVLATGVGHAHGACSFAEGTLALPATFPFNMSLLVACEKATMKIDSGASPSLVVYPVEGEAFAPALPKPSIGVSTQTSGNISDLGGYYNEIKYFVECTSKGQKPTVVTPEAAREAVRICVAVTKAAQTGKAVKV